MQHKKSTKDTRNAAYKRLKAEFDTYMIHNTVRLREVRKAREEAEAFRKEYNRRTVELNKCIAESEALKIEVEHLRSVAANCECEQKCVVRKEVV